MSDVQTLCSLRAYKHILIALSPIRSGPEHSEMIRIVSHSEDDFLRTPRRSCQIHDGSLRNLSAFKEDLERTFDDEMRTLHGDDLRRLVRTLMEGFRQAASTITVPNIKATRTNVVPAGIAFLSIYYGALSESAWLDLSIVESARLDGERMVDTPIWEMTRGEHPELTHDDISMLCGICQICSRISVGIGNGSETLVEEGLSVVSVDDVMAVVGGLQIVFRDSETLSRPRSPAEIAETVSVASPAGVNTGPSTNDTC